MDKRYKPFPASPKDGECFLREDGYIYRFDATRIWWEKLKRPVDYLEDYDLPRGATTTDEMIKTIIKENLK